MLGMLGLVLMLGVGFVALYLFNTTQHDVALRGEGGFLERLHLPSTLHEEEGYAPYIPAPRRARPGPVLPSFRESFAGPITGECARGSVKWQTCDAGVCSHNHLALVPGFDSLFVRTAAGERTTEFVHRVLVKAWGSEPPMIDLYVHANDQTKVDAIVPRALLQNYSVHVVYEHQPCFPGSREFQRTFWYDKQFFLYPYRRSDLGAFHGDPAPSFRVDSFPAYFAYINATRSVCYERLMVDFYQTYHPYVNFFCWMCQLSAYIKAKRGAGYEVRVVEDEHDNGPFLRFAAPCHVRTGRERDHVPRCGETQYCPRPVLLVWQDRVRGDCEEGDGAYLRKLIFTYAGYDMNRAVHLCPASTLHCPKPKPGCKQ
ncbi:hypothetical protein BASA81_002175 [Batrachochytrium salamandrivorans]|nr:hypothetical protein BASA81_002175 [Batrachochytrium salamandrivorans]